MSSLYSGLNTARTGLMASQTALDLTAQNISNANTEGYTRQSLELKTVANDVDAYRLAYPSNLAGNGVDYSGVSQSRDSFLDVRYRDANASHSDWQQQSDSLSSIEDIFNELSSSSDKSTGLSGQMTSLLTDLQEYQNSPTDATLPSTIRSAVGMITFTVNNDYQNLAEFETQEKSDLSVIVDGGNTDGGINSMLDNVAALNKQIASYEVNGQTANDLRDQRNLILDKLSGYLDIQVQEQSNGMVSVSLSGDSSHMLISNENEVTKLQLNSSKTGVYWDDGDPDAASGSTGAATLASISGGSIDGYLQVINGDGSGTGTYGSVGIPYIRQKLNDFAVNFDQMLNSFASEDKHSGASYSADDITNHTTPDDYADTALISYDKNSGDPAATLKVSDAWLKDDSIFAGNYTGTSLNNYIGELIQNLNADGTVQTKMNPDGSSSGSEFSGSILDFADSFTGDIATAASKASGMADSTGSIVDNIDSQRQSISSVSIDEEGINIIKFQQSYNASARVITAIDEMLDKLINGTGTT